MTAPIDTWLTPNQAAKAIRPRNQAGVRKVRYLLSTLTCGKCKHITPSLTYAPDYLWVCLERSGVALETVADPACRAFVPKEPKR